MRNAARPASSGRSTSRRLKGRAPDTKLSPVGNDAQSGVDDGGATGVIHPNAAVLASKRTWLAAMPQRWVSSDNYVYLATDKLRRIHPSSGVTVEYTFPVGTATAITANDEFVAIITDSAATWYDAHRATDSQRTVKGQLLSSIALGSGNFAFNRLESAKPALYVYHPVSLGDPLLVSAIDTPAAVIVGTFDRIAFLHGAASTYYGGRTRGCRKCRSGSSRLPIC